MVNLAFANSLDLELVQQKTVVTMDEAMADYKCPPLGIPIDEIPLEHYRIQVWFRRQAEHGLDRMRIRGFVYWDPDDIHVYGPFPSRMLHDNVRDLKAFAVDEQAAANLVHQPGEDRSFKDYWLVANFIKRGVPMNEEALQSAPLPQELLA